MTSWAVIDAGVLLATVLANEPLSQRADALLQDWVEQGVMPAAPALLQYEIVAVIRKHVHLCLLLSKVSSLPFTGWATTLCPEIRLPSGITRQIAENLKAALGE